MQEPITKELLVENKMGIHARPAAMFVKVASQFNADIFVEKDGELNKYHWDALIAVLILIVRNYFF